MNIHEDKTPMDATGKGGMLARKGRKKSHAHSNKKTDPFQKARAKRSGK